MNSGRLSSNPRLKRQKKIIFLLLLTACFIGAFGNTAFAALTCGDCHGNPPVDNAVRTGVTGGFPGSHDKHAGGAGLSLSCAVCHVNNISSGHRNGSIEMATPINGDPGAAYSKGSSFPQTNAAFSPGTCTNVYCHGTVQGANGSGAGTDRPAEWGAGSLLCSSCHADMSGASATGTHVRHTNSTPENYNMPCSNCHPGYTADSANNILHANKTINVAPLAGAYSGGTTPGDHAPGGGYGTCSTVYCHSNALPVGLSEPAVYKSPEWGGGVSTTCYSCHKGRTADTTEENCSAIGGGWDPYCSIISESDCGTNGGTWDAVKKECRNINEAACKDGNGVWNVTCNDPNSLTMTSNGHDRLVRKGWREFKCSYCHYNTVDDMGGIKDRTKHVNAVKDVVFDPLWAMDPLTSRDTPSYNSSNQTCSNIYCHSDGTLSPKTEVRDYAWAEGHQGCNSCHGHRNEVDAQGTPTCRTSGCHDGLARPVKDAWEPEKKWLSAMPMYESEGPDSTRANSHWKHMLTGFSCDECHVNTVKQPCRECHGETIPTEGGMQETGHIDPVFHVNKTKDVVFKQTGPDGNTAVYNMPGAPGYNAALPVRTCVNTACHTDATFQPRWGEPGSDVNCLQCHKPLPGDADGDTDSYAFFNGTRARISIAEWETRGHGRKALYGDDRDLDPYTRNPPANFPTSGNGCLYCHDNLVLHSDPTFTNDTNPYRLRQHQQFANRFEKECVYCHMERKPDSSECLGCHYSQTASLAPQVRTDGILYPGETEPRHGSADAVNNTIAHTAVSGCLTGGCHDSDGGTFTAIKSRDADDNPVYFQKGHNQGIGTTYLWTAEDKADLKNLYTMAGVCLKCHDDDGTNGANCKGCHSGYKPNSADYAPNDPNRKYSLGFDPGSGRIKPQKAKASSFHFGYKHYQAHKNNGVWKGGKFCWDCHDPHGDGNSYMIHDKVTTRSDGKTGRPYDASSVAAVVFRPTGSGIKGTDYAQSGSGPKTGICNVCHTNTRNYQNNNGNNHNERRRCTECHEHRFTDSHGSGQSCNTCHQNKPIPRHTAFGQPRDCTKCHKGEINNRIDIVTQLTAANSHHIQGVTLTNKHCYACHWEATELGLINTEYHSGYNHKTHNGVSNKEVDLVIWQPDPGNPTRGKRPTLYTAGTATIPATVTTFLASSMPVSERTQVSNVSKHCIGCHSDQNNDSEPFADGKSPNQYAWDRQSIAYRYSQLGSVPTTTWGKYSSLPNASQKNIGKAFSAHGNAEYNYGGGWNSTTGVDGTLNPTRGGLNQKNVQCFDCHSSHGSYTNGITSSYVTFNGTRNGANLKETRAGRSGYAATYMASSNTNSNSINPYSAGAGQCFDCHENANRSADRPWGYSETFGSTARILGYKDAPKFGSSATSKGSRDRYSYKKALSDSDPMMGGHFKRSHTALSSSPTGSINGLCTPCHDPHGVSPALGDDQAYAVPLLKGTWLTSPYKEDAPPPSRTGTNDALTNTSNRKGFPTEENSDINNRTYETTHTDQRTFGSSASDQQSSRKMSEDDSKFAGLCLKCHPKNTLTDGVNSSGATNWKTRDRIHESVKGWGDNEMHAYSCSKCHQPHVSALPRLLQTNCFDTKHRGRVPSGGSVTGAKGGRYVEDPYGNMNKYMYSSGGFPHGFSGGSSSDPIYYNDARSNYQKNCHPGSWPDNTWNELSTW